MCVVCGCANKEKTDQSASHEKELRGQHHDHDHFHSHSHEHPHPQSESHISVAASTGDLHYGAGAANVSVPGMSQARAFRLEQNVLGENNRHANHNRDHFVEHGILALNLVSSPGSGKTTLLCATIEALQQRASGLPVAVIEGDQQTSNDADRIRATGAPAIQINTGKGCHLDAQMVGDAFSRLPLLHHHSHHANHSNRSHDHHDGADTHADHDRHGGILFIENVGNLVCPAMWDLGEAAKVVILSVTEGEDKPLKYPDMFAAAQLMVLNKIDLLPYVQFDVARCIAYARRVNPRIQIVQLSASTGEGMVAWIDWIMTANQRFPGAQESAKPPALTERIAALEAELLVLKARVEEA
ncbi:hydrogenase nickel incorporation protein HypB [Glaciimonas sp. PCH181]|uniref:hydrogenase nickel incorporation protein HypB n=1 Tax=Glaciimonas sp. PCH181 TaxID=2133943 RepID=UPI000D334384|nr:hydrogenase nickel incorporation protein HypB [Glaciimonas sp. PCH181]PUA19134.1 hypothetical protein C7W93_04355 [Glaciimonas sp. PCH181]